MSEEVTFELKDGFEYARNGNTEQASFISLTAPNFKQLDHYTPLKQFFMKAMKEIMEEQSDNHQPSQEEASESDGIGGSEVIKLMYASSVDMKKVLLHAQELFKAGVALIDGETRLTVPLMEKMSLADFEGVTGAYLANFIAPSLLDGG